MLQQRRGQIAVADLDGGTFRRLQSLEIEEVHWSALIPTIYRQSKILIKFSHFFFYSFTVALMQSAAPLASSSISFFNWDLNKCGSLPNHQIGCIVSSFRSVADE